MRTHVLLTCTALAALFLSMAATAGYLSQQPAAPAAAAPRPEPTLNVEPQNPSPEEIRSLMIPTSFTSATVASTEPQGANAPPDAEKTPAQAQTRDIPLYYGKFDLIESGDIYSVKLAAWATAAFSPQPPAAEEEEDCCSCNLLNKLLAAWLEACRTNACPRVHQCPLCDDAGCPTAFNAVHRDSKPDCCKGDKCCGDDCQCCCKKKMQNVSVITIDPVQIQLEIDQALAKFDGNWTSSTTWSQSDSAKNDKCCGEQCERCKNAAHATKATEPCCTPAKALVDLRVYPVADLVERTNAEHLIHFLTNATNCKNWQPHGGTGTMQYCPDGTLVVSQASEVQEQVQLMLDNLRVFAGTQCPDQPEMALTAAAQAYPTQDLNIPVDAAVKAFVFEVRNGQSGNLFFAVDSPKDAPCTKQPMVVRVYPMAELSKDDVNELTGLIARMVAPETWQEVGGPGSMGYFGRGKVLVVRQTPGVHKEVQDFLTQLGEAMRVQASYEKECVKQCQHEACCDEACSNGQCCVRATQIELRVGKDGQILELRCNGNGQLKCTKQGTTPPAKENSPPQATPPDETSDENYGTIEDAYRPADASIDAAVMIQLLFPWWPGQEAVSPAKQKIEN